MNTTTTTTNTQQPEVARKRRPMPSATVSRVLTLRRVKSAKDAATTLGLPIGTVKAICSRAGLTRSNPRLREFFQLPEPVASHCTEVATPTALPEQVAVTGDKDVDAMLWLRRVVETGDADLIAKALEAAKRITTPAKELELRYGRHLAATAGSSFFAALGSLNFANLEGHAKGVIERKRKQREAMARMGGTIEAVFATTLQEQFCMDTLALVPKVEKPWKKHDPDLASAAFEQQADLAPNTLDDCLYELKFWSDLYWLRSAFPDHGDHWPEVNARTDYLLWCMGRIKPKTRAEAKDVLSYLVQEDGLSWAGSDAILENLIGL